MLSVFYTPCGVGFYCDPAELPAPGTFDSLTTIKREHTGHYFDPATLRWFGDKRATLRHGFARVVEQEPPAGVPRFAVTYWHRSTGSTVGPTGAVTCRHATRDAANRCEARVARDGFVPCRCGARSAADPADHCDTCPVRSIAAGVS
jgi:hypothetical protein